METFKEKLKKSFDSAEEENPDLNNELLDYLIDQIIDEVIEYDRSNILDFKRSSKKITNNFIRKAEQILRNQ